MEREREIELSIECIDRTVEVNSWEDMKRKYPMYRDEATEEQEKEFVSDCYMLYEKEGFSKVFWSQSSDLKEYVNKPFKVLGHSTEEDTDLCCMPMWNIQFEDGHTTSAYPDEIIPREMKRNGCELEV